ncbi:MAG: SCP2 sterol-binding domain-containing protein [Candidatus Dormibacteria bacterium]
MAEAAELAEALADYQQRCNANERLRRMLRNWDRVVHLAAVDNDLRFTMLVRDTRITSVEMGLVGRPDIVVRATSEDFCDMFWGDLNPAEKYLNGDIKLEGSADDVMRIDAMSMVMFLNQ